MPTRKRSRHPFLTVVGGLIFVGSQAWEWKNFIQGEYGAVESKGGSILQFVNSKGERLKLSEVAVTLPEERVQHKKSNGIWFSDEATLPSYSVNEVLAGFKAKKDVLVRIETIYSEDTKEIKGIHPTLNKEKHKIVLNRAESEARLATAKDVVEGANLQINDYGSKLFADFFFFITGFHGFHEAFFFLNRSRATSKDFDAVTPVLARPETSYAIAKGLYIDCFKEELRVCRAVLAPKDREGRTYVVYVDKSSARAVEEVYYVRRALLRLSLVTVPFALMIGPWAARRVTMPIENLRREALEKARGESPGANLTEHADDVGDLAAAMNTLLDAIAKRRAITRPSSPTSSTR